MARIVSAGLLLCLLGLLLPGCALVRRPAPAVDSGSEEWRNAGCDQPMEVLLPLLGNCGDLKTPAPGRKIILRDCVAAALVKGRLNDESIRVRTYDLSLALEQLRQQGGNRLECEKLWLNLDIGSQEMVLGVETAYWRLVQAHGAAGSREQALAFLDEEAKTVDARYEEKLLTRQDVDALAEQRHLARVEWLTALGQAREAERTLRRVAGLVPHDGTTLVPCSLPVRLPPGCDPAGDLQEARLYRPELCLARIQVEIAVDECKKVKDEKLKPLARLKVEREEAALRNAEEVMLFDLQRGQRQMDLAWQVLEGLVAREDAARRRLEAVTEKWQSKEFGELRELLQARMAVSAAQRETLQALAEYQIALAEHRRRKGVLLKHHRVCIERQDHRPVPGD